MVNLGNRDLVDIEYLRKRFIDGEYAISDHAIIEARKDGIVPRTVEKLEWAAINGKVIEEYIGLYCYPPRFACRVRAKGFEGRKTRVCGKASLSDN